MCAYFVEDALIRAVVQELNGKVLCVALDLAYPWLADRRCYRHSRASKDTRAALYAACWPASMSVLSCNSKWMRVILICTVAISSLGADQPMGCGSCVDFVLVVPGRGGGRGVSHPVLQCTTIGAQGRCVGGG